VLENKAMGETIGLKTKVVTADRSMGVAGEGEGREERVMRPPEAAEFKGRNLCGKMYILSEKTKRFPALNIF
jgi:hypothetical protein